MAKKVQIVLVVAAIVTLIVLYGSGSHRAANPAANPTTNPLQSDTFLGCTALDGIFIDAAANQTPKMSTIDNAIYFGMRSPNSQVKLAAGAMKWAVTFAQSGVGGDKPWNRTLTRYAVACHALHIGPGDS